MRLAEDRAPALRAAAIDALAERGAKEAVPVIAKALALRASGDPATVQTLARRYRILWGATNRGYCQFSSRTACVPDYDIELTAGVAIPDPKVGVVRDGVVLEATVLKIEEEGWWYERGIVHDALVRLAGVDAGPRPEDWQRWLAAKPVK